MDCFYYRMTLLLGPPGCGKTTLLKALSGNLDKSLKVNFFFNLSSFIITTEPRKLCVFSSTLYHHSIAYRLQVVYKQIIDTNINI